MDLLEQRQQLFWTHDESLPKALRIFHVLHLVSLLH